MSKFVLFIFVLYIAIPCSAQKTRNKQGDKKYIDQQLYIIAHAKEVNDHQTEIGAYYNLLSAGYNDSIVHMNLLSAYFINANYLQSYLLGKKLEKSYRDNILVLDIYARSGEMLGKYKESIDVYDKLIYLTSDSYYTYLCAHAQYMLGRMKESAEKIKSIIDNPDCRKRFVSIGNDDHTDQEVTVQAALYNLSGAIYESNGDGVKALEMYSNALSVFPEFVMAKKNVERLKR